MLKGGRAEALFADRLRKLVAASSSILDIGTPQRFAKELRRYEPWFSGKRYVAAGYEPQMIYGPYDCDEHQDIERMTYEDGSFDGVICLEVLEHVADPFRAASELKRVLRPGGHLLLTVPFLLGYHGKDGHSQSHEAFPDHWRFTHQALARMFGDLRDFEVRPLDGPIEVILKQARLERVLYLRPVRWMLDRVDRPALRRATSRHLVFGTR